jgi:hypothetical protein
MTQLALPSIIDISSSMVAVVAIFLTIRTSKDQTKATDILNSLEIMNRLEGNDDRLNAVMENHDRDEMLKFYIETLNFMEVLAVMYCSSAVNVPTYKFCETTLASYLAMLRMSTELNELRAKAATSGEELLELARVEQEIRFYIARKLAEAEARKSS